MSLQNETLHWLQDTFTHQDEFIRTASDLCCDVIPIVNANKEYKDANVLRRILTPNRVIDFKVEWERDSGACEINRGFRVQHSNLLGPYKGGTRFHPSVNGSILRFLALEQSFKNALTLLPLGAGKGGSDFNPKTKSNNEIRRFCNAFMENLYHHIGDQKDVPAGDINVSSRELGYMFAKHVKMSGEYSGALSGKPIELGGSQLRTQATGFGLIYFVEAMLGVNGDTVEGKTIKISGAGNVALHAAKKAVNLGAKVLTLSNSRGCLIKDDSKGLTEKMIDCIIADTASDNPLEKIAEDLNLEYCKDSSVWSVQTDLGLPCATQNEITEKEAKCLLNTTSLLLAEGANMPCSKDAETLIQDSSIKYAPGKAANAGGVVLSAFEMQQNASLEYWKEERLDTALAHTMNNIHDLCLDESKALGNKRVNYVQGANVAGFRRLADATLAQGY